MANRILKILIIALFLLFAVFYVAKFGGPSILKMYIRSGIGDCQTMPLFCKAPGQEMVLPEINKAYLEELKHYRFEDLEISIPKEIKLVKNDISRAYYKKRAWRTAGSIAYVFCQPPNTFIALYPQMKKEGIQDDYAFMQRIMYANYNSVRTLSDTFFVIMKSIFIPDLGDQKRVQMIKFKGTDKKGFISYNVDSKEHYFDCNMYDKDGNFFKVYIKDRAGVLDLKKVFTILSTVKKIPS